MANHVTSFVRIMADSSNVLSHWRHRMLPQMGEADPWASLFQYSGEVNREWMCSAVGAKWSFVEYADEDCFELCSAWSHPSEGITGIAHILGKEAGPDFVLAVTYVDEMPNFFGCEIIDGHGFVVDYEEWSNDDLLDYMLENVEGLAAEYVDDELTSAGWEIWHENVWDCVSLLQEDWMNKCLKE